MPELPEVETTRAGLAPWLAGATLLNVVVRNASLRWPVPVAEMQALQGQQVRRIERRAKYLLIYFEQAVVLLHLGMSGSLRVLPTDAPVRKHDHLDLVIALQDPTHRRVVRFTDPRRFGCCLVLKEPVFAHPLLTKLGPEPLADEFDGAYLQRKSRRRKLAVKNFIMDGHVVVGVGNIYASEALFLAGIRPGRAAGRVTGAEYADLAVAIKHVLTKAIAAGGTTLNDFTQSDGQPGYFKQQLYVYGRAGAACYRCDAPIKAKVLGQRSSFYCPDCQR